MITVLIAVSFKRRSIVYFYLSPFHSRILAVLIQTSDQMLNTSLQVSAEGEGGPRSVKQAAVTVPPKKQRELQLKTGMVAKDKLEANLSTHPHNAVLCEQLSLT